MPGGGADSPQRTVWGTGVPQRLGMHGSSQAQSASREHDVRAKSGALPRAALGDGAVEDVVPGAFVVAREGDGVGSGADGELCVTPAVDGAGV